MIIIGEDNTAQCSATASFKSGSPSQVPFEILEKNCESRASSGSADQGVSIKRKLDIENLHSVICNFDTRFVELMHK